MFLRWPRPEKCGYESPGSQTGDAFEKPKLEKGGENPEVRNLSISELGKRRAISGSGGVEWRREKVSERAARGILPSTTKPTLPSLSSVSSSHASLTGHLRESVQDADQVIRKGGHPIAPGHSWYVSRTSSVVTPPSSALHIPRFTTVGIPVIQLTHRPFRASRFEAFTGFTNGHPRAKTPQDRPQTVPPSRLGDGGRSTVIHFLETCRQRVGTRRSEALIAASPRRPFCHATKPTTPRRHHSSHAARPGRGPATRYASIPRGTLHVRFVSSSLTSPKPQSLSPFPRLTPTDAWRSCKSHGLPTYPYSPIHLVQSTSCDRTSPELWPLLLCTVHGQALLLPVPSDVWGMARTRRVSDVPEYTHIHPQPTSP